ncbi:MAG: NAD(P)/FAD-dependent oxidoreductase [Deltaproteobacteria bacterium]
MVVYDVLIIGAGPAGLTAGLYAGRARLKTLIVEQAAAGGQVLLTETIENFPGVADLKSFQWADDLRRQVTALSDVVLKEEATASRIEKKGAGFVVTFDAAGKQTAQECRAVIVATGAVPKRLDIPGEKELTGKGVSYCATCDGPLYRNKEVVVVGGGNSALEEALFLARFASRVTLVHRRTAFRAVAVLEERVRAEKKIVLRLGAAPEAVEGEGRVQGLRIKDAGTGEQEVLACAGVFVFVGSVPQTGLLEGLAQSGDYGTVRTDETMATSTPGLFACGDCRHRPLYQIVTACAEGAIAAHAAGRYLESPGS